MNKYTNTKIEQDDNQENPRNDRDTMSTFYGVKGRYIIGGKQDLEYQYRDSLEEHIDEFRHQGHVIVEFSTDAGECYAVIDLDTVKKEYGDKSVKSRNKARRYAEAEIEEFQNWANGEVYGYIITDNDGETLDSCWGFYGYEYCKEEAERAAKGYEKELKKQVRQIMSRLKAVTV